MKFAINFLSAAMPLTKTFRADGTKESYPLTKNFTSYSEQVSTIQEFYEALIKHAKHGHCLLKGTLRRNLVNEPRVNATATDDTTRYVCLDFDRFETPDLDAALKKMGLGDVSYVIQHSSSHGLADNIGTVSAHVFMLLDTAVPAPRLKAWLMALNLDNMKHALRLSRSKVVISWPLDITTCQNDKLLYIAPPIFEKPLVDPLAARISLVKRKKPTLSAALIGENNINALKQQARVVLNEMREMEGLPRRTAKTSWKGKYEIENKPDTCDVSEIKDCGEYVRLNINGGDSWAYWHPKDNFEIIHDFKSDTHYLTKDFLPGYYATCISEKEELAATPTDDGDLILAFRDLYTAKYYNGIWNPEQKRLQLHEARNETQLDHWMRSHGRTIGDFIPTWKITYDPKADWVVDEDNHTINTFRPSKYMEMQADERITTQQFPEIYSMVRHFLGEVGHDKSISDHFLNWLAVIFQRKNKPLTAWVNHGTQGTGKGYFMAKVITPLFGTSNVAEVGIDNIEDQFNSWLEGKLFVNVNEIDVDDFTERGRVEAKFKMLITDKTMPIRRMRQSMTQEPNYASFLFSSNKRKPVAIPPDDRRYNVGHRQAVKIKPPEESVVASELEAFAQWLLAHKADVALSNTILHNEARAAIQKLGVTSLEETCNAISSGDFDWLWLQTMDDELLARAPHLNEPARQYNSLIKHIGRTIIDSGVRQTISRDEMGIILNYNVSKIPTEPAKLTSLLRHNGIETKQIRHNSKKTYGIHVIWRISAEIRAELEDMLIGKPKLRRVVTA